MSTTPDTSRQCSDCRNVLPRGTCGEPEKAGLFPAGHGFGIVWAPEAHAATCDAFQAHQLVQEVAHG